MILSRIVFPFLSLVLSQALARPAPSASTEETSTLAPSPSITPSSLAPVNATERKTTFPVSVMPKTQISTFQPFTHLTAAVYCSSASLRTWSCGAHCSALPGMTVYAAGGNNKDVPNWYVGYLPSLGSAVVAHQGTNPFDIQSILIDANFVLGKLNPTLFPGLGSSIQVHSGFATAHGKTANTILAAVKNIMSDHGVTSVTCVGHSLGAALAVLDAISLRLALPAGTSFNLVTYGQPRVGNQQFANYVDSVFPDASRITNKKDLVPVVPPVDFGFHHSSGEKHIDSSGNWNVCSGQDNQSNPQCSAGAVSSILLGNMLDHLGPYDGGIMLGLC